jgi:sugar/nucleoside kinase (ribokinase family)
MNGKFLVEEMNRYGVNPKFIVSEGENSAITLAISFKDGERHFITQLGAMDSFSLKDIDTSIFKNYTHLAYRGIWFAKHLLENADQLMRMAKESGLSTSMDLGFDPLWALNHPDVPKRKSAALAALPYVDYLFGNQNELKNLTDTQTLEEAILKIQDHGVGTIVIHMGSKGARIVRKEEVIDIPVFKIEIINPVGSGDTFDSIFIGSVIEGKPLKESGNNASAGAAYSISHPAGTILDRSLIEQFRQNKG